VSRSRRRRSSIGEEADEDLKRWAGVTLRGIVRQCLDHRQGALNWLLVNLATPFWRPRCSGLFEGQLEKMVALACWRRSSPARRQCRDPDHDGGGARVATRELGPNTPIAWSCARPWSASSTGLPFAVIHRHLARWPGFKIPALGVVMALHGVQPDSGASAASYSMVLERVRAGSAVASGPSSRTITDVVASSRFSAMPAVFGLK